jgi:hypothetical protein
MNRWRWVVLSAIVACCSSCGADDARSTIRNGGDAAEGVDGASGSGQAGQGGYAGEPSVTGGAGGVAGQPGSGGSAGSTTQPVGGPVDLPGVYNARNEGGLVTASGQRVKHQVLIRSGHLADLGSAGCQRLGDLGIRSVVDLRAAEDASATPDAPCVASTTKYYLADLPKILPPSAASYGQTLDAAEPKLAAIFAHLSAAQALPSVVHCVIGRDRASLVMAVLLLALGVPQSEVANDFVENQDASVDVDAAWLAPLFDRVSAAGGIEPYLLAHGVTQVMIDKLRSLALESP